MTVRLGSMKDLYMSRPRLCHAPLARENVGLIRGDFMQS